MVITAATDTERSDRVKYSLTDLHTHILPQFDDGADSLETAWEMLRVQKRSGVDRVMLTSHFYPLREELDSFLERRQLAYSELLSGWDAETMPELRLGAEVRYSAELLDMDLRQVTLGESDYLLLELSDTRLPSHIRDVADGMMMQGITPVLAHVERCTYFRKEPDRLLELISMGVLAQVSAKVLKDKEDKKFAKACLDNGLAHVIVSDAHGLKHRTPCLGSVTADAEPETIERAEKIARAVWNNETVPPFPVYGIKKTLFGYK